jgi:hypothetical protein
LTLMVVAILFSTNIFSDCAAKKLRICSCLLISISKSLRTCLELEQ